LAIDVAGSSRSRRVIKVLSRLVGLHGAPRYMKSDNGPEFVPKAILEWIVQSGIQSTHIDPGKPWQNGTDKSINGKFRDECLSLEWFRSTRVAKAIIEGCRQHYNTVRPHSSLDYLTLHEFKATLQPLAHPKVRFKNVLVQKKDLRAPPPGPICERLGLARRHQIQSPRQRGAFGRRTRRMRSRVAPDGPTDFTQIKIILTLINFNALASQFRETLLLRVISFAEYGAVEPLRDQRLVR
tara:strand:- start:7296 stop:8012 length:717 start_codon:yes stop_codon:yes gene_type:complete